MALNPLYITAPSLQTYFVDKDTGAPLAGGKVFFYRDSSRSDYKDVFELQGNEANYSYAALPNPITLSDVGTMADNDGNDIIVYYYPLDADGEQDLYYIVVQSSLGVPQFTRQAWPNPGDQGTTPESSDDIINYIPNGQFLSHTNLYQNELVAGSNVIAQGGFSIELDPAATSTNTLEFVAEGFTDNPPQSPRYLAVFEAASFNPLETIKSFRVSFRDVNKFSTKPGSYTFGFWATANVTVPVLINVFKYFGTSGSASTSVNAGDAVITTSPQFFQVNIDFGSNAGKIVDIVNNNDFVAIDILFPNTQGFTAELTDFVLTNGDVVIENFPVQTDADMLTRGVMGWVDDPSANGFDLYLPPILTRQGMTWDNSQVGTLGESILPINDPLATSPIPDNNQMPCDGAIYQALSFAGADNDQTFYPIASNGIPFKRLADKLILWANNTFSAPLYGTGSNYVTMECPAAKTSSAFRIVYNIAGTGSTLAADGAIPTGWTFAAGVNYAGVSTGTASIGYFASGNVANTVLCVLLGGLTPLGAATAATSGFTVTENSDDTGITAFQDYSFTVTTTAGAALVTGGAGKYFQFSNSTTDYYMWFQTGTETDPAVGGRTAIMVYVADAANNTAQDVYDLIRDAISSYNFTQITMTGIPSAGEYFRFYANPSAIRNFYVWFTFNGAGADPNVPGAEPIRVDLVTADTTATMLEKLLDVINGFQFQAPNFEGMFFRAADPDGIWDTDNEQRWSYTARIHGAIPGTFEYQQILSHTHPLTIYPDNGVSAAAIQGTVGPAGLEIHATEISGGAETRPINAWVYKFIRY